MKRYYEFEPIIHSTFSAIPSTVRTMNVLDLSGTNGPIDAPPHDICQTEGGQKWNLTRILRDDQLRLDIHEAGDAKA